MKRVYEDPRSSDGVRVLVDRLWPRGISKDNAALAVWLRDLAPSDDLRHWFHSHPDEWASFRRRYLKELSQGKAATALDKLYALAYGRRRVTLLFASRNEEQNNAIVLKELLEGLRKPPTGTGPGAARPLRQREAKRMPKR